MISDAAAGRLAESLAREGGFNSVRWAGSKSNGKDPVSLRLGFSSNSFSYCLDLGLPIPSDSAFDFDAEMKRECLWHGASMDARSLCADRGTRTLRARSAGGKWSDIDLSLSRHASMLSEYADPFNAPELIVLNEPENSLHPDLIPALGRLIKLAAENSQVIVVSHSPILVRELESDEICVPIRLRKDDGATVLQDGDLLSQYGWKWPSR